MAESEDRSESDQGTAEREERARFPVVGIGASAGGLEALELLVARLSIDSMAFVVLQHLAPGKDSLLADILARNSSLAVVTIVDGLTLAPRTIYVAPPGVDVSVTDGVLHTRPSGEQVPRLPIDTLFRSLATDVAERAIGVVLSGSGSDGTLGMRALKEAGAITFAQEPSTAIQPGMPQSAIDAGCVDYVLSAAEIGDELMRLSRHPFVARKPAPGALGVDVLVRLFDLLRRTYGVDFSAYKPPTIERRIQRRMALQKLERFEDYLRLVESSAHELDTLYADLLIGVTGFFRDKDPFAALSRVVFPRLLEHRSTDSPIRVWVPGCSSGEEAYSIAMCLLEVLDHHHGAYKVQIFGTDIDEMALTRARAAVYPRSIEADVSPERLHRFFTRVEKGYQLTRQVRDMVVFARHNLGKDPPFSRLDLVSCRNVLIYMQPALQRKLLRTFHYALNTDAFLLLGTSESVGDAADLFTLVDRKLKVYAKKNAASAGVFEFALGGGHSREERGTGGGADASMHAERRPSGVSVQQLADRKVLDKFGPPGLLIDERLEVLQFRGQMGPYLGPTPGNATLNVLKLIRPELLVAVRGAVTEVAKESLPVSTPPIELAGRDVIVDAMPLGEPSQQRRCVLLLFRETAHASAPGTDGKQHSLLPSEPSELQRRLEETERELLVNKEYLQSTVQELEASNEELQSANEELQSANEELQSSNEELETSKEELQSTNEELATVNEELQNRLAQLSVSNDDLRNLLHDTSVPVVIVGQDLRIRRFSNAAASLLNLIGGDVGRPIAYLGNSLNAPEIGELIAEAIRGARDQVQRVRCSDGRWYTLRATPYRTAEETIRGAIVELLRSPPSRKAGELPEVHELAAKLLAVMPHARVLLDDRQRLVWVNSALSEAFQLGAEVVGRPLDELWDRGNAPELWRALESRAPFADTVAHPFGRERAAKVSLHNIAAEGERPPLTMMVLETEGIDRAMERPAHDHG